jgi:hypothetical protein
MCEHGHEHEPPPAPRVERVGRSLERFAHHLVDQVLLTLVSNATAESGFWGDAQSARLTAGI